MPSTLVVVLLRVVEWESVPGSFLEFHVFASLDSVSLCHGFVVISSLVLVIFFEHVVYHVVVTVVAYGQPMLHVVVGDVATDQLFHLCLFGTVDLQSCWR